MIIVYTVVPAVLVTLLVATGIYMYKRKTDLKSISAVSARSDTHLREFDLDHSKKEIMSEFKLGDEEAGFGHSRNGPRDFYTQMSSQMSQHTTMDVNDPMINGQEASRFRPSYSRQSHKTTASSSYDRNVQDFIDGLQLPENVSRPPTQLGALPENFDVNTGGEIYVDPGELRKEF
jgi:hypothetical protein